MNKKKVKNIGTMLFTITIVFSFLYSLNSTPSVFGKEKELVVIPAKLYEITDNIEEQNHCYSANMYSEFRFQRNVIYNLNSDGFIYRCRISNLEKNSKIKHRFYRYDIDNYVKRPLFIKDTLYAISESMIKLNDTDNLSEINSINFIY